MPFARLTGDHRRGSRIWGTASRRSACGGGILWTWRLVRTSPEVV